ncbi:hypothetical protein BTO06_05810 [Tenacibaculum sp. SZ-18]|uniref:hypothetical protein n=1 Tax=Tenacibaculum sp. SZ-18 TaxID=754423 RepID=UPI000C2CF931|nr:hypothetical protein [Tenacibaculum sp. SZ-18]AUC14685.1 hypothetical protein BTO06_05810 [Tenacibaculum sp. SZ-18]
MKQIIVVVLSLSILSCSQKVSKKDLEGSWKFNPIYNSENGVNYPFFNQIIFKGNNAKLIDYFGYSFQGTYKIKKDTICISFKDSLEYNFNFYKCDSILEFDSNTYEKYQSSLKNELNYNLIDLESDIKMSTKELNSYINTFHLLDNSFKPTYYMVDEYLPLTEILHQYLTDFDKGGWNVFLSSEISNLKQLKSFFIDMAKHNALKVNFITKVDISKKTYDIYTCYADVWNEEIPPIQKEEKINPPPSLIQYENKKAYIKYFKPKLLQLKSERDFEKLDNIEINSNYLISINIDIPIKKYFKLIHKINNIRTNKNIKIRTELIEIKN